MQNAELIKRIEEIKTTYGTYSVKGTLLINNLLGTLRSEMLGENAKTPTGKNRIKSIVTMLNTAWEKEEHLLSATTHFLEDGRQVWMSPSLAVILCGDDIIAGLPRDDQDWDFPRKHKNTCECHYQAGESDWQDSRMSIFARRDCQFTHQVNVKQLLAAANASPSPNPFKLVFIDNEENIIGEIALLGQNVKNAIIWGNLEGDVEISYRGEMKPIFIDKPNGTTVLVAPVRTDERLDIAKYKVDPDGTLDLIQEEHEEPAVEEDNLDDLF